MVQIGNVPEIIEVKNKLEDLKQSNLIDEWELPYENLLTRLDAAMFYLKPSDSQRLEDVWDALSEFPGLKYEKNDDELLSKLEWLVQFK